MSVDDMFGLLLIVAGIAFIGIFFYIYSRSRKK
ncbi:hypothetical protein HYN48_11235 [Flavobacterium magnum]|uniref:LPXTG cell wall anchor domain-containing protein n=1 Tax=Flavobacterium magnum TaxID=2162713 RepID=A0A2S0RG68_9FLAO|nr:LPXTG cell wall anchor domain-containing protein [Flavobacterium magnum]AWA30615.1 hypothetical protein HYN48_11235 [Flavobacterium magnum]